MGQLLDLGGSKPEDSYITREVKKRTWWTLYMADRWCSAGLGIPRLMTFDLSQAVRVSLPMDETTFQMLRDDTVPTDVEAGIWSHMVVLADIFGEIHDLNRRAVAEPRCMEESSAAVHKLETKLNDWKAQLPANRCLNEANMQEHSKIGLGGCFVALHLGYHHYATLLYFQFLDRESAILPERAEYLRRCKLHASSYSDLLSLSRTMPDCEAVYPTVAHMALVSSAVLLHILSFGEEYELEAARKRLSNNFQAILNLRNLWPSLASTVGNPSACLPKISHLMLTCTDQSVIYDSECMSEECETWCTQDRSMDVTIPTRARSPLGWRSASACDS